MNIRSILVGLLMGAAEVVPGVSGLEPEAYACFIGGQLMPSVFQRAYRWKMCPLDAPNPLMTLVLGATALVIYLKYAPNCSLLVHLVTLRAIIFVSPTNS